jgi:hypothetical protein
MAPQVLGCCLAALLLQLRVLLPLLMSVKVRSCPCLGRVLAPLPAFGQKGLQQLVLLVQVPPLQDKLLL